MWDVVGLRQLKLLAGRSAGRQLRRPRSSINLARILNAHHDVLPFRLHVATEFVEI